MRFFHIHGDRFIELGQLPADLPAEGFVWASYSRSEFEQHFSDVQHKLQRWDCG